MTSWFHKFMKHWSEITILHPNKQHLRRVYIHSETGWVACDVTSCTCSNHPFNNLTDICLPQELFSQKHRGGRVPYGRTPFIDCTEFMLCALQWTVVVVVVAAAYDILFAPKVWKKLSVLLLCARRSFSYRTRVLPVFSWKNWDQLEYGKWRQSDW